MMARRVRDERGAVGVLEGLMGAVIGSLVLTGLMGYWVLSQQVSDRQAAQSQTRGELTRVVDEVARDVRSATVLPYASETNLIVEVPATERAPAALRWYGIDEGTLTIRERPIGGDPLTGWVAAPVHELADVTEASSFTLLDASNRSTTELSATEAVRFVLTVTTDGGSVSDRSTAALPDRVAPLQALVAPVCPEVTGTRVGAAVTLTWPRTANTTDYIVNREDVAVATILDDSSEVFTWTAPTAPIGAVFLVTAHGPAGTSDCPVFARVSP